MRFTPRIVARMARNQIHSSQGQGKQLVGPHACRLFSRLQRPPLPVAAAEVLIGLGAVGGLQARGVPLQLLAHPIGHVAQQHRFGQRAGVVEVAGGRAAGLAGLEKLLVVADRVGDRRLRRLEAFELLFRIERSAAVVGPQHALPCR